MKSVLKFVGIILVVALVSFGVSVMVARSKKATVPLTRFEEPSEYRASDNRPVKLTGEEANFAFLMPDKTELRYYHARTGEIKKIDLVKRGSATVVATIKPRALSMTWAPDGSELIAEYSDQYLYANLSTGASKALGKNIFNPAFSKTSHDVAYVYFNDATGEGNISIADSQFKNYKNILKTRLKNWELQWNTERRLSLIATVAATKLESFFVLDTEKIGLIQLLD